MGRPTYREIELWKDRSLAYHWHLEGKGVKRSEGSVHEIRMASVNSLSGEESFIG